MDPLVLCLETSTSVCSVAICQAGQVIALEETPEGMVHGEQITLLIQSCLKKANVNLKLIAAVAVSAGPGSYTGLRIGISTAKGLCMALNIPLIALDSLEILSYSYNTTETGAILLPMIDARRMEVYTAVFDSGHQRLQESRAVIVDQDFIYAFKDQPILLCGDGYQKTLPFWDESHITRGTTQTSAAFMAKPVQKSLEQKKFTDFLNFSPFYLKSPNITVSRNSIKQSKN